MCDAVILTAIAIGAATGAATSAATGGDPLQGALIGGATAGFFPGTFGVSPTSVSPGVFIDLGVVATNAAIGLGLGYVQNQLLAQPELPGYTPAAQQVQYNSQNIETTGSGGRQATASLADAIKRSKQRKLTQEDVGDLSIDTSSFANTGLQLA